MPAVFDEHGVPSAEVPKFVTPDTLERWLACAIIATKITRQPDGHPENALLASSLFHSPAELGEVDVDKLDPDAGEMLQEARVWRRELHPVNRFGRFIDTPDRPDPKPPRTAPSRRALAVPPPKSPGTFYTYEQIRDAGLDAWPEPGPPSKELLGDAKNTRELHSAGPPASPGTLQKIAYSAERNELHDQIIAKLFAGKTPPPGQPHALFTAGGTASGKSTMLQHNPELEPPEEHTIRIDSDTIKEMMPDYQTLRAAKDRYAASAVHAESGDIAARALLEAMDGGFHVVIDGTGNNEPGDFVAALNEPRKRGYTIDLIYANAPTDLAISWSIRRADEKGRFVPVPAIREIHAKVSRVFNSEIVKLDWLNRLDVYENGELIGEIGEDNEFTAVDAARLAAFRAKEDEVPPRG